MRKLLVPLGLLLSSCTVTTPPAAPTPAAAPVATTRVSGLDVRGFDASTRPADDLFGFAAGGWLQATQIPPDRSNYGAFTQLADQAEADVREIVESLVARDDLAAGSDERKVADLYRSFMDVQRLASLGLAPLADELARIERIRNLRDLIARFGYGQRLALDAPLRYEVEIDARNTAAYVGTIAQAGLTLPNRDYYLKPETEYQRYREQLRGYATQLLAAAGESDAGVAAARIMALETALAAVQWTQVQNRDALATYNRMSLAQLAQLAPQIDWPLLLQSAGAPAADVVVAQPSYIAALGRLIDSTSLADWRAYLRFKLLDAYAPLMPPRLEQLSFEFHEHALQGVEQPQPRDKRALSLLDQVLGEVTGRLYVERHFSAEAKQRMQQLVGNLLAAFRGSIDQLEWMGPQTRAEAHRKLDTFLVKIGYPDKWRDYARLQISATDLVGNVQRYARFESARKLARLGLPVDRGEWGLTTPTINAYYGSQLNEIVFPAAILQPPFFDLQADDAVNYGAIGASIGHEISHAFDDQGRHYDAAGQLRDWWTAQDAAQFERRAQRLVTQFAAYTVLDGQHLDGQLTLGENIADLSGLELAYRAYTLSLRGHEAPILEGFTGPQRFFLGWAQIWRRKYRDDNLRMRLSADPHSPARFRTNGAVINMDAFHAAFGTREQDQLYRAPAERVKIW